MTSRALPLALLACVLVAGCTGLPATRSDPGEPLVTVDAPGCGESFEGAPPASPNATAAREFALACEASRIVSPEGHVYSDTSVLARSEAGFYVRASVLAGTETGGTSAVYLVGNGTYERVAPDYRSIDSPFHSSDPDENSAFDASLLNFGDRDREVALTLTYLNSSSPKISFDRTYSLAGGDGVFLTPVTMRIGTYAVAVRVDGERVLTRRVDLTIERSGDLVVAVEPTGDLRLFRVHRDPR